MMNGISLASIIDHSSRFIQDAYYSHWRLTPWFCATPALLCQKLRSPLDIAIYAALVLLSRVLSVYLKLNASQVPTTCSDIMTHSDSALQYARPKPLDQCKLRPSSACGKQGVLSDSCVGLGNNRHSGE